MKKFFLCSLFFSLCVTIKAQQSSVITRSLSPTSIEVKWYSKQLIYPQGVNIYRQEKGKFQWEKLNLAPIVKGDSISKEEIAQDEDLEVWQDAVNGDMENMDGLLYIQLISKTFLSPVFSDFIGIRWIDSTVVEGKSYTYKVNRIINGRELSMATSTPVTAKEFQKPKAPQGLTLDRQKLYIKLNWTMDDEHFFAYNIYRTSVKNNQKVKVNNNPVIVSLIQEKDGTERYPDSKFEDDSLEEGLVYQYYIAGIDFFGEISEMSEKVTLDYGDITPPKAPYNLKNGDIKAKEMLVPLTWENNEYTEDALGINVYRSVYSDSGYVILNEALLETNKKKYEDEVPQPGGYYYYIATVDGSGNQGKSLKIFVEVKDVIPPQTPQNVKVVADTNQLKIVWTPNKEPDLAGYWVYQAIEGGGEDSYVLMTDSILTEPSFTKWLPKNVKNKFNYKIVAIDTSYNRSPYSKAVGKQLIDVVPPETPVLKEIREQEGKLVILWTPNKDIDLAGYDLYRSTDNKESFKVHNLNTLSTSQFQYTDRRALYGHKYYYYLVAKDRDENVSTPSQILHGELDPAKKPVEGAKSVKLSLIKKNKIALITWSAPKNKDVKGYVIHRKDQKNPVFKPVSGLIKEDFSFQSAVDPSQKYSFQLRTYYPTGQIVYSKEIELIGKKYKEE